MEEDLYIVRDYDYNEFGHTIHFNDGLYGIFTTKEKAIECLKKVIKDNPYDSPFIIVKAPLNIPLDIQLVHGDIKYEVVDKHEYGYIDKVNQPHTVYVMYTINERSSDTLMHEMNRSWWIEDNRKYGIVKVPRSLRTIFMDHLIEHNHDNVEVFDDLLLCEEKLKELRITNLKRKD